MKEKAAKNSRRLIQAVALSAIILVLGGALTVTRVDTKQQQVMDCDAHQHLVKVDSRGGEHYATCTPSVSITRSQLSTGPMYYVCYIYQWTASVSESYSLGGNQQWQFGLTAHWSGSTCTNTITGFENPGEIYPLYMGWGWYIDILQNSASLSAPWEVHYYDAGQLHFIYVANAGTISCSITDYIVAQPTLWCD